MKALNRRSIAAIATAVVLIAAGCDKAVGPTEILPPLNPTSTDAAAGTWHMILMTGPTQIAVPAPTATNSAAYLAELDAIKSGQKALTSEQRSSIAYWSGGGVMRWNQIVRELVARYSASRTA